MNVRGPSLARPRPRPRPGANALPAISVRGLRKSFGNLVVLDGIDFDVHASPDGGWYVNHEATLDRTKEWSSSNDR